MTDAIDTGALGPSGRFARMEAALERIELKLDLKADTTRVVELEAKHNALAESLRRMASGESTTPLSQLYLQRFTEMEKSIEILEQKDSNREAVLATAKSSADSRFALLAWAVGLGTLFNILLATLTFARSL